MVKEKIRNETSRDRFKRLAEHRTKKVLEALRILGNCSNPHGYEYDQGDVKIIFSAIEKELRRVRAKFEKPAKIELEFD